MNFINNNPPHVTTALRVRPPLSFDEDSYFDVYPQTNLLRVGNQTLSSRADYIFGSGTTQELIFDIAAKPLLEKFLKGEDNVTIAATGPPTGGKTFTLFGPGVQFTESAILYGIYPRLATYMFSQFDDSFLAGNNPHIKVSVSFIEVDDSEIRNLLNNVVLTHQQEPHLPGLKTQDFLRSLEYQQCLTARDMINCLHVALINRRPIPAHVFAEVIMEQSLLQRDGKYKIVKSSALFADIQNTVMEHPSFVQVDNQLPVILPENHYVLSSLAVSLGGRFGNESELLEENHLFNLLKESFNGERCTLVFSCLPPWSKYYVQNQKCISEINLISDMKKMYHNNLEESLDWLRNHNLPDNRANSLIIEAESLLSRLSVSKSVTDEDQEKVKNWLHMKKECENDSLNAQSHGQLECIEEVTESEEEIASSNEKMSESPISLDNSLSESDQEEGDSKVCDLSDNNFFNSLDNMCVEFNTFVDKFVDSFKGKMSLSPAKERKRDFSAARRGGMPELPKVNELQAQMGSYSDSLELAQSLNELTQPSTSTSSHGCARKTPSSQGSKKAAHSRRNKKSNNSSHSKSKKNKRVDKNREIYMSDTSADEETEVGHKEPVQRSKESGTIPKDTLKKEIEEKNPDGEEKHLFWTVDDKPTLTSYGIMTRLKQCEEDIHVIRSEWNDCMNQGSSADKKGENLDVNRNNKMFYALSGIDNFITMMKDNLNLESSFGMDAYVSEFHHMIRWHRLSRQEFTCHKNNLETGIKNKTATDEEMRDYLMADEIIETLDSSIEFLNYMLLNNKPYRQKLPNTPVSKDVMEKLKSLTPLEMRNLMLKYFMKVVDLRESSKQFENMIADYEQKIDLAKGKICNLSKLMHGMRTNQSQMQTVANFSPPEGAVGGCEPSPPTLALTEGSKSRKGPSIPHQNLSKLQVTKAAPPTKVTFTNKKLIIEQSSNQNKH